MIEVREKKISDLIRQLEDATKNMVSINRLREADKQVDMAFFLVERMKDYVTDDSLRVEAGLFLNAIQEQRGGKRIKPFKTTAEHSKWLNEQAMKRY